MLNDDIFCLLFSSRINIFLLGQFLQKGAPTDRLASLPIIYTDTNLNLIFSFSKNLSHLSISSEETEPSVTIIKCSL